MPSWADLNKRQQKYQQAVYEVDQAQPAPDMEKSEPFDLLSSIEKGSDHGKEEDQEEEENIPLTERNSSKNTEAALIGWFAHKQPYPDVDAPGTHHQPTTHEQARLQTTRELLAIPLH